MKDPQTNKHTFVGMLLSLLKGLFAPFTRLWEDVKQASKVWQNTSWKGAGLGIRCLMILSVIGYAVVMTAGGAVLIFGYGTAGPNDGSISDAVLIGISLCAGFANLPITMSVAFRERNDGHLPQGGRQMRIFLTGMLVGYGVTLFGTLFGLGLGLILVPGNDVRMAVVIAAVATTISGPIGLLSNYGQSVFSMVEESGATDNPKRRLGSALKPSNMWRVVRILFSVKEMWMCIAAATMGYCLLVVGPAYLAGHGLLMFANISDKLLLNSWVNLALFMITLGAPLPQDILTAIINKRVSDGYLVNNAEDAKAVGSGALSIQLASLLGALVSSGIVLLVNLILAFVYPLAGARAKTLIVQLIGFYVGLFFGTWTARIMAKMLRGRASSAEE